jgi:hypothetical protein
MHEVLLDTRSLALISANQTNPNYYTRADVDVRPVWRSSE